MPTSITMPSLSPTMTEGNLARWLKAEGESVNAGDPIAEIETDKAMMEVEATCDGVLGKILVPDGTEGVEVNTVIGIMLLDGEESKAIDEFEDGTTLNNEVPDRDHSELEGEGGQTEDMPNTGQLDVNKPPIETPPVADQGGSAQSRPVTGSNPESVGERIAASPLARRMAEQAGIDLNSIKGTGPGGRIVKADIEASQTTIRDRRSDEAKVLHTDTSNREVDNTTEIKLSNMRRVIARRLTESKQSIPHFYLTVECEIDQLLTCRKELNNRDSKHGLTINDFVVKAAALALQRVPEANSTWNNDSIVRHSDVDIAVAVALEDGLITPIVRDANKKGLATISSEIREMAARGREGKLMPDEYQGGTLTISNLGMYGVREFVAIINPPQSAILAVGSGEERAVVKDGALAIATTINVTLSADHRVVDGSTGANYLNVFKSLIEDPLTMLL